MSLNSKKGLFLLLTASIAAYSDILSSPRVAEPSQVHAKLLKTPSYGGSLVIGHNNSPAIINPILTDSTVSMSVMTLVFNRLVQRNADGEICGDLAKSWEISQDGLAYTFHLRPGIKFHDEVEITAEDILYTYERIKDPQNHSPYFRNLNLVRSMEAVDRYTFRIILNEPSSSFIYVLVREVVPKHLYEKGNIRSGAFNHHPIGTGPFRFVEWNRDNQITLEANPEYFEGRPFLNRVVYKFYSTDSEVWSALMRGEVDLAEFLSVENYELIKKDPSFKTYANATSDYYLISYNLADPLVSDQNVRTAIAHAIDIRGLIDRVEKGYGLQATGPFSEKSWAFNPEVHPFPYDPALSVRLLKEAGWSDSDGDGILDKSGLRLSIRMLVNSKDEKLKKMAMFIRQNLQEAGIDLQIQLYRNLDEIDPSSEKKFQAVLTFFLGPILDPNETIKLWYSQDRRAGKVWSYQSLNSELDKLIYLGSVTTDQASRQKIYREIHRLIYQEQTACFLYFPFDFHAISKKFGGSDSFLSSLYMPDNLIRNFYVQGEVFTNEGGDN